MNNTMFITKNLEFYPGYLEDDCTELSDEIILPSYHLNRIMETFNDGEILYVNLTNTETNISYLVTLGSPHNYDKNTIFVSQWILDIIGCSGCCDSVVTIEKAEVTEIPLVTKITIKPLDPIAFEINTQECFEKAFMNLHSIKQGLTIPIPVPQLGKDYIIFAHIEKVEPENISRIVQAEVDVEFINEFKESEPLTPMFVPDNSPVLPSLSPLNQIVTPTLGPIIPTAPPEEINAEERRKIIRESWVKRFQNNVERQ